MAILTDRNAQFTADPLLVFGEIVVEKNNDCIEQIPIGNHQIDIISITTRGKGAAPPPLFGPRLVVRSVQYR